MLTLIRPETDLAPGVRVASTTRGEGVSLPPYNSLNLGDHVADAAEAVAKNRDRLNSQLNLPAEPCWLEQVHGTAVATGDALVQNPTADAAVTDQPDVVLAILTADCLPVMFASDDGQVIGAAHAGWRSLLGGVLEDTVRTMGRDGAGIRAWLGPAIGPTAFEIGAEVYAAFVQEDAAATSAFRATRPGHWHADLAALARRRLARCGVHQVGGGQWCTYTDPSRFFSYRRDGQCGRMATLIWRTAAT